MNFLKTTALALAAAGLMAGSALAQEWPGSEPVKIIVPAAPGGAASLVAQAYADMLSKKTGGTFIIENQGGASGTIGTRAAINSKPDGHTFLWANLITVAMVPQTQDLDYDISTGLTTVALPGGPVSAMGVPATLGVNSVQEFVDLAKSKPGELNYGEAGIGSATDLPGAALGKIYGIQLTRVPYSGGAPAIVDLLAGRIQAVFEGGVLAQQGEGEGKLKVLAILGDAKHPAYPDIPLMKDLVPEYKIPSGHGVFAPAGTPKEAIEGLRNAIISLNEDPATQEALIASNFVVNNPTGVNYDTYIADLSTYFAQLATDLDLKAEAAKAQ